MPIYDQTYRAYDGTLRPRFRWLTIVRQELRVLFSKRMFIFLVLMGNFHFALRILQVFFLDVYTKQPYGVFGEAISSGAFEDVGAWVYFDFLRIQSPLLFLTLIYSGSGLICNDFRNNLMEVFFSKPLNWKDYVAGKVMTLVTIGLCLSALPALILGMLHVMFTPTTEAIMDTLALAVPTVLFSLLLVGSFTLAILATSALINSSRFAGVAILMVTMLNITMGSLLAGLTNEVDYIATAYPMSLNLLGETLFNEQRFPVPIDVHWSAAALFVVLVCSTCMAIICTKVRRAELGR